MSSEQSRVAQLTLAAERGDADAMFNLGVMHQFGEDGVERDARAAAKLYRQAADLGHAKAMQNLAVLFQFGDYGVQQDLPAAIAMFRQSGDLGNVDSLYNMGVVYERGYPGIERDLSAAAALFRQAADLGHTLAMFNLGLLLQRGEGGVEKNVEEAMALFRQAAGRGHAKSMYSLGRTLLTGDEGIEVDIPAAVARLREASQLGSVDAMYSVGVMLRHGKNGVMKDAPEAAKLFRQAADQGHVLAMRDLGQILERGEGGVERDAQAAVALYWQAVWGGNADSMNDLGVLLERGEDGVRKDVATAGWLYRQSAMLGKSHAMVNLGGLLQRGEGGIDKDVLAAKTLFGSAAELGNAEGMYNLGVLLTRGEEGVKRDLPAAMTLYRQAADRGNVKAMNSISFLLFNGIGVRRDVAGALGLQRRAAQSSDVYHNVLSKITLARMLLSEDVGTFRNPAEAAGLLEEAVKQNPTYGPALHELAVLLMTGDDDVRRDQQRSASLHSQAASQASYDHILVYRTHRLIIEAGENYVDVIEEILRDGFAKPKTCLLLTLGGGGRGKTSTMNRMRGMPFAASYVPTEMADLSRFVVEAGVRGVADDVIAEYYFNENSLRANVSRIPTEVVSESELRSRNQSTNATAPLAGSQPQRTNHGNTERPHADVIERVRRSILQENFPIGFKGSVVQVWDMAGQSQYEMAHSMMITRSSILVFVTDLSRVADERTRKREVRVLCYWMQLAYMLVPNASATPVLVVGTRKGQCKEGALGILKEELTSQLASKVYNSWIRAKRSDGGSGKFPKFIAIENSEPLENAEGSGLEELERAVKAAGDEVVAWRDAVPLRWLALVDKLEREHHVSSRIYLSREDIHEVSVGFPGFVDDEGERERDVLTGLRCFATMGRLVLLELDEEEWYVFMDAEKIIDVVGRATAPEELLRDLLSAEDICGLKQGRISRNALFQLWEGYREEEKSVMLKLLCRFDLLMLLDGGEETVGDGSTMIGVPALMAYGWDDFKWGYAFGEKDLEITTRFDEAIPNGLVGMLIAHMHRVLALEEVGVHAPTSPLAKVRADAALLRVRDGSRVFVGFRGAERELCWKFRGQHPIVLARECIRRVEELLNNPVRFIGVDRRHILIMDCQSSRGGCDGSGTVEVELSERWIIEERGNSLPTGIFFCRSCVRPWSSTWWGNFYWLRLSAWGLRNAVLDNMSTDISGLLPWSETDSATGVDTMQPVMDPPRYVVFISHAGPDKLTLAEPLYKNLARQNVHTFLDMEGLRINEETASEVMERAMREARIGIFVLSPEFAGREWPMKELRHFLARNERCKEEGKPRPVLLPVFHRLSLDDCEQAGERIYGTGSEHYEVIRDEGFFKEERQSKCSTEEAIAAFRELWEHSGVEVSRIGGGEDLSSAAVVEEAVKRVLDYMGEKGLLTPS